MVELLDRIAETEAHCVALEDQLSELVLGLLYGAVLVGLDQLFA